MELSWELYQTALLRLWSSEEQELERAGVGWVLVTASLGENSYFLLNKHHSLTKSIFKSVSTIVFLTMISTK
jgi:3-deoxy-D-manno-octulosonic-acid transferase